jgi:hypothetical protein
MAAADAFRQNPTCRVDSIVRMNTERNRDGAFWRDREPYKLAAGATTPVLWTHGFFDANTKPVGMEVWSALRGPKHAWFGQFTHLRGHEAGVGRRGFLQEAMRFLDRHVRGVDHGVADPAVTVQEGNGNGRWRAEEQWPPADGAAWSLPIRAGQYTDGPGNTGDGPGAGNGHWTLTKPLPHAAHLAGEPIVTAQVLGNVPDVNVVAHLYDVDEKGSARLVTRGATAAPKSGFNDVRFDLYPQDWAFQRGHRIAIHLSGADDDWYTSGVSNTQVGVVAGKGSVRLPLLRYVREESIAGGRSESIDDARPFAVPAAALRDGVIDVAFPPAQARRPVPAAPSVVSAPPISGGAVANRRAAVATARRRATLRLRIARRRGKRVLVVSGRRFRARRVALALRFGRTRLARRTVKVRRGAFRATFAIHRLRAGRLTVQARPNGRGRPMVAGVRLR